MCPMANMYEPNDYLQGGNLEKRVPENLLKGEGKAAAENVCRDEESIFKKGREIEESKTIPSEIAILQTKKKSLISNAEEDLRKPWYFTRV
jgi:hypothetical protein